MVAPLFLITGIIFLGLGIFNAIARHNNIISKMSTVIFIVAGGTYLLMSCLNALGDPTPIRVLRYIDWFITVPIMIGQLGYFFSGGFNFKRAILPLSLALLMLGAGLAGELGFSTEWGLTKYDEGWQFMDLRQHEYKQVLGMIGIGFMFNLFIAIARCIDPEYFLLFLKVLLLWCFYPVVFYFTDNEFTLIGYSVVDLSAKAGIGFLLDNKFKENSDQCST